jgi:hypothetical protein
MIVPVGSTLLTSQGSGAGACHVGPVALGTPCTADWVGGSAEVWGVLLGTA